MAFRQLFERLQPNPEFNNTLYQWLVRAWNIVGQVQEWLEVGGSGGEPAFQNSWTNFNTVLNESAGFYRDPFGRVHLKGVVGGGTTAATIFTLPAGYRPAKNLIFANVATGAFGRCDVSSSGNVNHVTGTNTSFSLDGISFRAEQ